MQCQAVEKSLCDHEKDTIEVLKVFGAQKNDMSRTSCSVHVLVVSVVKKHCENSVLPMLLRLKFHFMATGVTGVPRRNETREEPIKIAVETEMACKIESCFNQENNCTCAQFFS
jgi:hypothetical protein